MNRTRLIAVSIVTGTAAVGVGLLPSALPLVPLVVDVLTPFLSQIFLGLSWLLSEFLIIVVSYLFRLGMSFVPCCASYSDSPTESPRINFVVGVIAWFVASVLRMVVAKTLLGVSMDLLVSWQCIARPSAGISAFICAFCPWIPARLLSCSEDPRCVFAMPVFKAALDTDVTLTTPWLAGLVLLRGVVSLRPLVSKLVPK
jgi:hypothetical protein